MTVTPLQEWAFLLYSLLFGFGCGAAYELFRFVRVLFAFPEGDAKKKKIVPLRILRFCAVFAADFCFVFALGVVYTVFLYVCHDGVARLYSFFALTCGAVAYIKTVGRPISFLLGRFAKWCRKCIRMLFLPLLSIFNRLFRAIFMLFKRISLSFVKIYGKIKERKNKRDKKRKRKPLPRKKEPYANIKRF